MEVVDLLWFNHYRLIPEPSCGEMVDKEMCVKLDPSNYS